MQQSFSTKLFRFADLSPFDLYEIMIFRQTVFIVEQNCPYLDADGLDYRAWHLLVYDLNKQLVAYTRLLPIDVPYTGYASIRRVVITRYPRYWIRAFFDAAISRDMQYFVWQCTYKNWGAIVSYPFLQVVWFLFQQAKTIWKMAYRIPK